MTTQSKRREQHSKKSSGPGYAVLVHVMGARKDRWKSSIYPNRTAHLETGTDRGGQGKRGAGRGIKLCGYEGAIWGMNKGWKIRGTGR